MGNDAVTRVRYSDGQTLRKQDLVDEQAYHLAMRRLHNIAQHVWGILQGLDLVVLEKELFVTPGFAFDGYGRELKLSSRQLVSVRAQRADLVDVWLLYERKSTSPPPWVDPCAPSQPYRWLEQPKVEVTPAVDAVPAARRPPGVPGQDNPFLPYRTPPDDPDLVWPVFLGRVPLLREGDDVHPGVPDLRGRPWAGLVGAEIRSPAGSTRVKLGDDGNDSDDGEAGAFSVHLAAAVGGAAPAEPLLSVAVDGGISLRGPTAVAGDLSLAGGAFVLAAPLTSVAPRPGEVYLWQGAGGEKELRVELSAGVDGPRRVVIGAWSDEDKAFRPLLTVDADRTVTVQGDLIVEGLLLREPPGEGPPINPETERLLLTSFLSGLAANPVPPPGAQPQPQPMGLVQGLISLVAKVPTSIDDFISHLQKEAPEILQMLLKKMTGQGGV